MDERATKTITDVGVAAAAAPSGPDDLRERDNRRALAPAPTSAVLDGAAPRSGGMTLQQMKKHASVDVADSKYGEALQKWNASKEKMMQDTLKPLEKSVTRLMEDGNLPKHRLVMLQVLLCKLIDFLDDGAKSGDNALIEERYLPRNARLSCVQQQLVWWGLLMTSSGRVAAAGLSIVPNSDHSCRL
ncbi:hypothetical protein PLESTF_000499700 [Pleodorina starrii]|nr:hypothetical protein PLESTM_000888800 [Pleodorina starrii]GLC66993.1 hypothetical protein PLESTF_000499700 [Pleodorina starrii]